ncbi:HAMP domain-containing sensor histidine kinase [Curtobacterium sp. ISL-83]|uniref:sensor histidine kinase n=1 Tax=Curtobacterium sp. ISL-83 TaxID=2819145 RepID=UPI001BE6F9E9|nr:HAMP domain-containing sensor histidine kinase [Curtobacterium sp. ISL-83]MBT2501224.1 HAMP domain-containing histidine kinase [Curtobacterium sp. ISL-83]
MTDRQAGSGLTDRAGSGLTDRAGSGLTDRTGEVLRGPRRGWTVTAQLVTTTVLVALLGAFATVGGAFALVQSTTVRQAQQDLRSTIRIVAGAPPVERATLVRNLDRAGVGRVRLLLVRADGTTVPASTSASAGGTASVTTLVPTAAIRTVQRDGTLSTRVRAAGQTSLLEGTRAGRGDAVIAVQDLSVIRAAVRRLAGLLVLAALAGAAVAGAIGALVARRLVRPLRRTAAAARRLADGERGILPTPDPHGGTAAEITAIDTALGALDAAITTSEGRQREFLLSVSHEIRTPLTGIRGYADALADGLIPPSATADVGRTLVTETTRLDAFVRDLLELARLQADDFPLRTEPVDLAALAAQSVAAWGATAEALDVRLVLARPPLGDPVPCVSDPMRVRQLLDGLLENALRASPPGSTVRVRAEADRTDTGPVAVLVVQDDGPGLTDRDAAEALERGVLADRYRNTRAVGTGLGLSIAARLVRRLGGSIRASARADGGEFTIVLPATP